MNGIQATQEFERIKEYLFDKSHWQKVELTRPWANAQPAAAGVYMLFEDGKPIYVGETGNIARRIGNMLNTKQHTIRRIIGQQRFSHLDEYQNASSKCDFPPSIEVLVEGAMRGLMLSVLPIHIGRKEFEEYICKQHDTMLNRMANRR